MLQVIFGHINRCFLPLNIKLYEDKIESLHLIAGYYLKLLSGIWRPLYSD